MEVGIWEGKPRHRSTQRKTLHVSLHPSWDPSFPSPPPESSPAILTEERTPIEADGGLAGHLNSIEDCVIELVREGQGLGTAVGRLRGGGRGVTGSRPGSLGQSGARTLTAPHPFIPGRDHGHRSRMLRGRQAGAGGMCQEPGHGGSQRAFTDGASGWPWSEERAAGAQGREEPLAEAQVPGGAGAHHDGNAREEHSRNKLPDPGEAPIGRLQPSPSPPPQTPADAPSPAKVPGMAGLGGGHELE